MSENIFSDWYKSLSEHIELFAAAFAKETNLNPREIKLVQQITSDGMKIWFEPFPDESELEMYRRRAELAEAEKVHLNSIIAGKDQTISEMAIEIADLKRSLNMAQSILSLISKHPITTQLEAAALKQLAVNYQTITQVMA